MLCSQNPGGVGWPLFCGSGMEGMVTISLNLVKGIWQIDWLLNQNWLDFIPICERVIFPFVILIEFINIIKLQYISFQGTCDRLPGAGNNDVWGLGVDHRPICGSCKLWTWGLAQIGSVCFRGELHDISGKLSSEHASANMKIQLSASCYAIDFSCTIQKHWDDKNLGIEWDRYLLTATAATNIQCMGGAALSSIRSVTSWYPKGSSMVGSWSSTGRGETVSGPEMHKL